MAKPTNAAQLLLISLSLFGMPAGAAALDASAINSAQYSSNHTAKGWLDLLMIKAEMLIDRVRFSPDQRQCKKGTADFCSG